MAWLPISYTVPQYLDTSVSPPTPASGFVLKAYQVGTTTNIPFATDNSGSPTANSIALNAQGYPEVSGNVVIPHMDQDYKLALYPDQASADADSGAIWTVDDIDLHQTGTEEAAAQDIKVWPLVDYGGAYFDGTNDYLTRGAGLTGASNGKKGTLVAFVTFDASATAQEYILHATGGTILLRRDADGVFRIIAENSGGTTILNIATASAYEELNTVYCIMASWDLASAGSAQIYVNDASDVAETTFTNDTIDYTVADWAVGADVSGSSKITGNIFSVWLDTTDNLDFDMELNRRRFLDEADNPVYLGVQGELPTGTQAILFLGNHDETLFETNRGSGGDFTENGTLAAATVDFDGQFSFGFSDAVAARRDIAIVTTQGDIILADSSGDESRLAIGSANTVLRSNGTTASYGKVQNDDLASGIKFDVQSSQSASGSTVTFTGLPSGARRITMIWDSISLDASPADMGVRLGDSGGVESSGYASVSAFIEGGGNSVDTLTSGFKVESSAAGSTYSGIMTLVHTGSNRWIASHTMRASDPATISGGGHKTLSAELDRVQAFTSANFDNGTFDVIVEID